MRYLSVLSVLFYFKISLATSYSIHFMWLNRQINPNDKYVFEQVRKKEVNGSDWDIDTKEYLASWIRQNPNANINFWYDATTVSQEQIENTLKLFGTLGTNGEKVLLRNIQELQTANTAVLFSPSTPLYLRADLFRIMAGLNYLKTCVDSCIYVYADIDKGMKVPPSAFANKADAYETDNMPISEKALLDPETLSSLENTGIVMQGSEGRPENNFIMLSNQNQPMMEALQTIVIDSNVSKINRFDTIAQDILDRASQQIGHIHGKTIQERLGNARESLDRNAPIRREILNLEKSQTEAIYNSMVVGPLMLYREFLDKKISISFRNQQLDPDQPGNNAALFSTLHTEGISTNFLRDRRNNSLKCRDIGASKVLEEELWTVIPRKAMYGSPSRAKNFAFPTTKE